MRYANVNELKNALISVLTPYNFDQLFINQLLSDQFVDGAFELIQNEPINDEFMNFIRNFSDEQNLISMNNAKEKISKELTRDGYFTSIFQYVIDAWRDIDFSNGLLKQRTSTTQEENTSPKPETILDIVLEIADMTPSLESVVAELNIYRYIIDAVIEQDKKYYDYADRFDRQLQDVIRGTHNLMDTAQGTRSPLIIDLDGDGVETTTLDGGVHFDHDGNGFAEKTAWVGKDDGLLVRDINNNGKIDDGTELFGNNTTLSNGQKATNGFEALKDLDSNNDGVFNNQDAAWNQVKIWKDKNQNGRLDAGELLSLNEAGIEEINLNYQNSTLTDENGNTIGQTGSFTKEDGTTGSVNDIWFNTDLMNTVDKTNIQIPDEIKSLPDVQGFGNVHSLQIAIVLDESGTLKSLVEQFAAETDISARKNILYNIIYHWTGVQDMPIDGRDPTQVYGKVIDDTRKLEALEEFIGEEYLGTWCWGERDPNPHGKAAPYILRAFDILADYVNNELLFQTHYKTLLENIKLVWNEQTEKWDADVSSAVASLQDIYNTDATKGILTFREFENVIKHTGFEGLQNIYEAFRAYGSLTGDAFDTALAKFGYTYGTEWDDDLTGTSGVDEIQGLAGNDSILSTGYSYNTAYLGAGSDEYIGDDGVDIVDGVLIASEYLCPIFTKLPQAITSGSFFLSK